ncbi:MAG: diguanylate cyclase [Wenzhouxiangellaceae bacterium]|nr:diguanylate cyclase [Wenzhouxiangellaceae bacterium]
MNGFTTRALCMLASLVLLTLASLVPAQSTGFGAELDQLERLSQAGSWREVEAGIAALSSRSASATPREQIRLALLAARTDGLAGRIDRGIDRLQALLERRGELDPDLELRALNLATNLLVLNDRYEPGFAYFRDALALAPNVENARMRADTYNVAADFHARIGESATAVEYANLAMQQADATEIPRQHCIALERRARAFLAQGRIDAAFDDFTRAVELCKAIPELMFLGTSRLGLGRISQSRGDDESAAASYRAAIDALSQIEMADMLLDAKVALGSLLAERGQFDTAEAMAGEIRALLESAVNDEIKADALQLLSMLAERRGDMQQAYEYFQSALGHRMEFSEKQRHMRLTLLMSDFDDRARQQQLELLKAQNAAFQHDREQQRQGDLAMLYAGSGAVIAGVLLLALVWQTARERKRFRQLSHHDGLTGLLNHTRFFELAQQSFQRARQTAVPFSLIIADVDLFKQINDQYGHLVGDSILRRIGARFREAFGPGTIIGRLGGEEFGVALPDCGIDEAVARIEHLRAILNERRASDEAPGVTMSFGVAELAREKSLNTLYAHADQALFDAKDAGRNRVITVARVDFGGDALVT